MIKLEPYDHRTGTDVYLNDILIGEVEIINGTSGIILDSSSQLKFLSIRDLTEITNYITNYGE